MPVLNTADRLYLGTPAPPQLVNMLTLQQATMQGEDVLPGSAVTYRLGGWVAPSANYRVGRTHALDGQAALWAALTQIAGPAFPTLAPGFTTAATGTRYPCAPGQTFTFMALGRSDVAGRSLRVDINFWDAAGAAVGAAVTATFAAVAGQFVQCRVVATAPAGAATVRPALNTPVALPQNEITYWRKAGLFAGDVPASAWVSPAAAWGQNLVDVERADVETNTITDGGAIKCGWRSSVANVIQWISGEGRRGTHAVRTSNAGGVTPIFQQWANPTTRVFIPVTPGKLYTALWSAKYSLAWPTMVASQAYFRYTWYSADQATVLGTTDASHAEPIPANTWVDWACSAIAPANTAYLVVNCYQQGGPAGCDITADAFGVYEGYVGAWIHPNTPPPVHRVYAGSTRVWPP